MKTIALLTDFGSGDNFVGVMKGVIFKINPRVNIVDISHSIEPQDIFSAAFLLKNSYKYFSKGTIFLAVVDPGVGSRRNPIVVRSKNYFFIGPDNGILSLAVNEDGVKGIVLVENRKYFLKPVSNTFHGRDIFAPIAAHLSRGKRLRSFGRTLNSMKKMSISKPIINRDLLSGEIIYADRFGNLVTNIDKDLFQRFTRNKKFKIKIKNRVLHYVVKSYQQVKPGKPLAIFDSFSFLELSVNRGSAKEYFKAEKSTTVSIAR